MDLTHPFRVAGRQVVVDGDHVHAVAGESVEIARQGGDQGLALAGLHLGHPAEVQRGSTHQLHVVVPLSDLARGGLAHHGEGLDQQVVGGGAVVETFTELDRLAGEVVVGQRLHLGFQGVDVRAEVLECTDLLALAGFKQSIHYSHSSTTLPTSGFPQAPAATVHR